MKGFLSTFNTTFLSTANITTPVINQNLVNEVDSGYWYIINWFEDGSSWVCQTKYYSFINYYFIKTINVGQFNILDYQTVSLLDPNIESCTKTRWDNEAYYGIPLKEKLNNLAIEDVFIINQKIKTIQDIKIFWRFKLLDINQLCIQMSILNTIHHVGFSYYTENGNNYIQIFIVQYVEIYFSSSGGEMWTNLGRGLIFYL